MKIIRIPPNKPAVSAKDAPSQRLHVGPVAFTCTSCGNRTEAQCSGMVFRTIEFYCSNCGAFYRVTNPAFGDTPRR